MTFLCLWKRCWPPSLLIWNPMLQPCPRAPAAILPLKARSWGEFLGSPVVRTSHFHCRIYRLWSDMCKPHVPPSKKLSLGENLNNNNKNLYYWCWKLSLYTLVPNWVLGEVEKNSFIAVPGKAGLCPSKTVYPNPRRFHEGFYSSGSRVGVFLRIRVCRACTPLIWPEVVLSGMKNANIFHLWGVLVL